MLVSVIVPARDAEATLAATLDGLATQDLDGEYEVIVVDDGSVDGTRALAGGHRLATRLLRRGGGGDSGAARNDGAAAARAPVLAFTDADCVPDPGWLRAGLGAVTGGTGLVQGRVVPARPPGPFDRTLAVEHENGLYATANLFVERAWWERAGGFRDDVAGTGRPFGEDTDFGWRVRRAGARSAFCAQAVVRHAVFDGGPATLLAERRRLAHFPALAARVPELRDHAFHRRFFLSPRTAAFDLALVGTLAAAVARTPLPLVAAVPYALRVRRAAGGTCERTVLVAADAVGFVALARGSVEARTPVL